MGMYIGMYMPFAMLTVSRGQAHWERRLMMKILFYIAAGAAAFAGTLMKALIVM